jgi:hypothetical protein
LITTGLTCRRPGGGARAFRALERAGDRISHLLRRACPRSGECAAAQAVADAVAKAAGPPAAAVTGEAAACNPANLTQAVRDAMRLPACPGAI